MEDNGFKIPTIKPRTGNFKLRNIGEWIWNNEQIFFTIGINGFGIL